MNVPLFHFGRANSGCEVLALDQERVALAFLSDGCQFAMAGDDYRFVGQRQHCVVQGAHNFLSIAAGEIGAANGSGEEGISRDQFLFRREVQADAAFGVAGGMQDLGGERSGGDRFSGSNAAIDFDFPGRRHADPGRLDIQHFEQGVVVLVEQDGCAGSGSEFHGSAHVIDVSVRDHDLLYLKIVFADDGEDVIDVVSWIDDHGLVSRLVADNGAIALQGADGKDFVDHAGIVASYEQRSGCAGETPTPRQSKPSSRYAVLAGRRF
jgi:hypothetical protein